MALSKDARTRIFRLVQDAKELLIQDVTDQLQRFYGIRVDGAIVPLEQLPTNDPNIIYTADLLRQRIAYLETNIVGGGNGTSEAIRHLIREEAFTILNRFTSLRMAEERGIIKETIGKGVNSEGFQVFDTITGQGMTAAQYTRYKWYLFSIFDELAHDLPAVFNRFSPYALLFPSDATMQKLLGMINASQMNLWQEDETIGWIYQYYNSREEITEMREASGAPRNSREMAIRNQFFTPRYIVQFLIDNSLGRIWYEMTEGKTKLTMLCQYLVTNANDIPIRKIKDPRELYLLDPACGSMHFGLYAYDLFEHIYQECWDDHPGLLTDLRNTLTREQFLAQIPGFIIRYNIYGVDIDPRALQIAGMSLWLRAHKTFENLKIPVNQRPRITKSNLVLAESMPGNISVLNEGIASLDSPMKRLVLAIWDLMKMAGEAGMLLRIEEEIDRTIKEIYSDLADQIKDTQLGLYAVESQTEDAKHSALYSSRVYRDTFLNTAETQLMGIFRELADAATNGDSYQKLLFMEDTGRGFAFIEICRRRYDVVVMNPPFGVTSVSTKQYIGLNYPLSKDDLAGVFLDRMAELTNSMGKIGCISTRTIFFLGSFDKWRTQNFPVKLTPSIFADLGDGVLDATVETAAYVIERQGRLDQQVSFIRALLPLEKERVLSHAVKAMIAGENMDELFQRNLHVFDALDGKPFAYWLAAATIEKIKKFPPLESDHITIKVGLQTGDDFRYLRNYWEVHADRIHTGKVEETDSRRYWVYYTKTDYASPFFSPLTLVVNWRSNGHEIKHFFDTNGKLRSRPQSLEYYGKPGISYMLRSTRIFPYATPENTIPTAGRAQIYSLDIDVFNLFAYSSSNLFSAFARIKGEQFARPKFQAGMLQSIPTPNLNLLDKLTIEDEINGKYTTTQRSYFSREPHLEFIAPSPFFSQDDQVTVNPSGLISFTVEQAIYSLFKMDTEEYKDVSKDLMEALSIRRGEGEPQEDTVASSLSYDLLQWLVGVYFGRYALSQAWDKVNRPEAYKMFQPLKALPLGAPETAPADVPEYFECDASNVVNHITKKIEEYFTQLAEHGYSGLLDNILSKLKIKDLDTVFLTPNLLFDYHLRIYSINKRASPIYWPISTASGTYTIWLYYPRINDQTLFTIINNCLLPKIEAVAGDIRKMESRNLSNTGLDKLNSLKDFHFELEQLKSELLQIANLPYKPDHDDGILISAAPLHKLFRHRKWAKLTAQCWKELEKGTYDWAHLAYSLWPDRVINKAGKDASIAIAHGLQEIISTASTPLPGKKGKGMAGRSKMKKQK